jgi:carbon-monoxide dehydrogenase catalytic subunit
MDEKKQRSKDPVAQEMIQRLEEAGIETVWDRFEKQQPQCGFGRLGICCRICGMGPCRIDPFGQGPEKGVCGADADTIVARNFVRMIAAGAAAHSDHGRHVAHTFLEMAEGKAKDYGIKDPVKLRAVARLMGIDPGDRSDREIAVELGEKALEEFGKTEGTQLMAERAPETRKAVWKKYGVMPRAVDREIVECMHRTHMGVDQDYRHLMLQGTRASLADGWGGSMLATELQDIMFGTPTPAVGEVNLGVLKEDEVNVIVHGHEPVLSEMLVEASRQPDIRAKAKAVGAKGITLAGICCTANELLMRHGIPIAGNFLHQELAIATGAVEAMVVDVQCVMQGLAEIAKHFHTRLISTSPIARIAGVDTHVEFRADKALDTAKEILAMAIENYKNRGETHIPKGRAKMISGFTHETINYMLGGRFRASYRPLNDNIINGKIRGIAAVVGCNNPKTMQDENHTVMVKHFIKNDVLVVTTGCGQIACAKEGLMTPEAARLAGPGLREVCETVGIPPVLACGSCVDNSRLLIAVSEIVKEGGLGADMCDVPVAGACLESMSEKAIAIGQYVVASGVYTVFNTDMLPILGSPNMKKFLLEEIEGMFGGKWGIESDPVKAADSMIAHIEGKRDKLGINRAVERKLYDMEARRQLAF